MAYDAEIQKLKAHLVRPELTERGRDFVASTLVLATAASAGDALAGSLLNKMPTARKNMMAICERCGGAPLGDFVITEMGWWVANLDAIAARLLDADTATRLHNAALSDSGIEWPKEGKKNHE